MTALMKLWKAEPVLVSAASSGGILAAIFVAMSALGYPVPSWEQDAIAAVAAAIAAAIARSKVTPTA